MMCFREFDQLTALRSSAAKCVFARCLGKRRANIRAGADDEKSHAIHEKVHLTRLRRVLPHTLSGRHEAHVAIAPA